MTARSYRRKPKHAEPIGPERAELEARYGQVWDTRQRARDFILGIQPACLSVHRMNDGMTGWLPSPSAPRFWLNGSNEAVVLLAPRRICR